MMKELYQNIYGGALVYILIAVALLAALTASFIEPASQQSRAQNSFKLATEINSQAQFIRSAVQDCIILHPTGDSTVNGSSTTDPGYHSPYPVKPSSSHFTGSTLGAAANDNAEHLRCPGNPGGSNDHTPIFGGSSGRFLSPAPSLFNDWTYYNGSGTVLGESVDGVFIRISSDKSDPFITEALQKVESQFSNCEADYIDGDGSNGCANGEQCFRIWFKRDSAC
jgi:type II secretory pathway pseudopilin PulG